MATYTSKLRAEALDGATVRLNSVGQVTAHGMLEPFSGDVAGAPSVFYVDGNVVSSGTGLSWLTASKTVEEGLAMAHAYQTTALNRAWSHNATVYVCGDELNEDLTTFAEKTDIIGVGSTNQHPRPRLIGNHTLTAYVSPGYLGCRWFNMEFVSETSGTCVIIPADQNGQEFHSCVFTATASATFGLQATQAHDMVIKDCWFNPNDGPFATAAIKISAGSVTNFLLENCRIMSNGIGLDFDPTSGQAINCWVIDNIIYSVGRGIDSEDDSTTSGLLVVHNRMITDADTTTINVGYDFPLERAVDNMMTGKDECDNIPHIRQSA